MLNPYKDLQEGGEIRVVKAQSQVSMQNKLA